MKEEKEKQIQEKYVELQIIAAGLKELQSNIQAIDEQIMDVMNVIQALNDLKNVKVGTQTLMTISPGIFVKAELKENKELLINVGAGITVKKSIDEAKHMLESRMSELKGQRQRFLGELESLGKRAEKLEAELNKLVKNV
jgi:prefoldin alpha subunit